MEPVHNEREPASIRIFINASPGNGVKEVTLPTTMFGNKLSYPREAYLPIGQNVVYGNGHALAEVIGGLNIYVLYNAISIRDPEEKKDEGLKILQKVLGHALLMIFPGAKEYVESLCNEPFPLQNSEEERWDDEPSQRDEKSEEKKPVDENSLDNNKNNYVKFFLSQYGNLSSQAFSQKRVNHEDNRVFLQERERELCNLFAKKSQLYRMVTLGTPNTDHIKQEYLNLYDIDHVMTVEVQNDRLIISTDTLFCKNPETNNYHEIGEFKITIFINEDRVHWHNLTRQVNGCNDKQMAPHIWKDGYACLGNMNNVFPYLIRNREFSTIIGLAIQFVESVNTSDPAGRYITRWPLGSPSSVATTSCMATQREVTDLKRELTDVKKKLTDVKKKKIVKNFFFRLKKMWLFLVTGKSSDEETKTETHRLNILDKQGKSSDEETKTETPNSQIRNWQNAYVNLCRSREEKTFSERKEQLQKAELRSQEIFENYVAQKKAEIWKKWGNNTDSVSEMTDAVKNNLESEFEHLIHLPDIERVCIEHENLVIYTTDFQKSGTFKIIISEKSREEIQVTALATYKTVEISLNEEYYKLAKNFPKLIGEYKHSQLVKMIVAFIKKNYVH
jgi:hypothetical protein